VLVVGRSLTGQRNVELREIVHDKVAYVVSAPLLTLLNRVAPK
jgi:hypothetical protein